MVGDGFSKRLLSSTQLQGCFVVRLWQLIKNLNHNRYSIIFIQGNDCLQLDDHQEPCNKDTGTRQCLQRRIRGVFLIISGDGLIKKFYPMYSSESPTQVAFIFIAFLMHNLKDVPKECWSDLVLAYDNM